MNNVFLRFIVCAIVGLLSTTALSADQCNTTTQCRAVFGPSATDCRDSRSNTSVCMCGSSACAPAATPAPVTTPNPVSGWGATCANEGEVCSFSGTKAVRYGARSSWSAGIFTNRVQCDNATFGDPINGERKRCETADVRWQNCASEGANCSFSGRKVVRYGANGRWVEAAHTNGVACTNGVFGDPISGTRKSCQIAQLPGGGSSSSSTSSSSSSSASSGSSSGSGSVGIPGRIQAQDYGSASPDDQTRNGATSGRCSVGNVDMGNTTDNDGVCAVGWTQSGEWLEYTFSSNSDGVFDLKLRLASRDTGKKVTVSIDGREVGRVTGPANGWNAYSDRTISNVNISAGEHTLTISFDDGGVNYNYIEIEDPGPGSSSSSSGGVLETGKFKHPGIFSSKSELDFVKAKINARAQPWKRAFDALKATNPTSRVARPHRRVPGSSDPSERRDMDEMTKDGEYAYASALLWVFTGEKRYADHAIGILNAWSIFEQPAMPLYLTWAVPHFINAAEILKHTPGSGWKQADINKFSKMVNDRMWPKVQLPPVQYGSNHGTTANESQFAIAIFLDDVNKFKKALDDWDWLVRRYIWLGNANRINGESNETCRDLNHMKLGMHGLMYAAESAWHQGVDLWSQESRRWELFTELHSGIMTGERAIPSNMCGWKGAAQRGKVFCKGSVPWSSPSGRPPCNQTAWELVINHLGERLDKNIPLTRNMARESDLKGGITRRNEKWESLLKAGVPVEK